MCQLQHPNIVGAEDIYLPTDIPVERRSSYMRLQRSYADHIFVRMPYGPHPHTHCNPPYTPRASLRQSHHIDVDRSYFPADMAWLIHSSTQVLTPAHVQVRVPPDVRSNCFTIGRYFCSTFAFRSCAALGGRLLARSSCFSSALARSSCF